MNLHEVGPRRTSEGVFRRPGAHVPPGAAGAWALRAELEASDGAGAVAGSRGATGPGRVPGGRWSGRGETLGSTKRGEPQNGMPRAFPKHNSRFSGYPVQGEPCTWRNPCESGSRRCRRAIFVEASILGSSNHTASYESPTIPVLSIFGVGREHPSTLKGNQKDIATFGYGSD